MGGGVATSRSTSPPQITKQKRVFPSETRWYYRQMVTKNFSTGQILLVRFHSARRCQRFCLNLFSSASPSVTNADGYEDDKFFLSYLAKSWMGWVGVLLKNRQLDSKQEKNRLFGSLLVYLGCRLLFYVFIFISIKSNLDFFSLFFLFSFGSERKVYSSYDILPEKGKISTFPPKSTATTPQEHSPSFSSERETNPKLQGSPRTFHTHLQQHYSQYHTSYQQNNKKYNASLHPPLPPPIPHPRYPLPLPRNILPFCPRLPERAKRHLQRIHPHPLNGPQPGRGIQALRRRQPNRAQPIRPTGPWC